MRPSGRNYGNATGRAMSGRTPVVFRFLCRNGQFRSFSPVVSGIPSATLFPIARISPESPWGNGGLSA